MRILQRSHAMNYLVLLILFGILSTSCYEPCKNEHPILESGGQYDQIGASIEVVVQSSDSSEAIGTSFVGEMTFYSDWQGGVMSESSAFYDAPSPNACVVYYLEKLITLNGDSFAMGCRTDPQAATLTLHFVETNEVIVNPVIGKAGWFEGEYRDETEIYAVKIYDFVGLHDPCLGVDNYE